MRTLLLGEEREVWDTHGALSVELFARLAVMDFRSLPAEVGDPLIEAERDWRKLSYDSREEIRGKRQLRLTGWRTWGDQESVYGHPAAVAVRVGSGKILTGDAPTKMTVTELLHDLGSDERLPVQGPGFEVIHGYGSVFDVGYVLYDAFGPYIEYMNSSAFDASLALDQLQVSYLRSHSGLGLATTLGGRMAVGVDDHGLGFAASLSLAEQDAVELISKLQSKSTSNQTSIGGTIRDYEWNEEYTEVEIMDWWMSRGEISSVHAGANPAGWADIRGGGKKKKKKNDIDLDALAEWHSLRPASV